MSFPVLPLFTLPGTASGGTCDYPAEEDVREGVTYADGALVGTLACGTTGIPVSTSKAFYHSAARVIQQLLIDAGYGTDPQDATGDDSSYGEWPVFRGREPDRPDNLIKISDTTPILYGDTMVDGENQDHCGVQVMVRGQVYDDDAYRKVNAVARFLDRLSCRTVTVEIDDAGTGSLTEVTYYLKAITRRSGPIPLGPVDTPAGKRLVFTVNYTLPLRLTCP